MERNVQRINGVKMDLARLSDEELENAMAYTWERIEAGHLDLEKLGDESGARFAAGSLARVIPLRPRDPNQGSLFDLPEPPEAC